MTRVIVIMAIIIILIPDKTAVAGSLFDKIRGTDVTSGAEDYSSCVEKVQRKFEELSRVLVLEGIAEDVPLELKMNSRPLSKSDSESLLSSRKKIGRCRNEFLKTARTDPDVKDALQKMFSEFDKVYADLINNRYPLSDANTYLVGISNITFNYVAKIEEIDRRERRARSAEGWGAFQKSMESLQKMNEPKKPSAYPSYNCYTNNYGHTNCIPSN